MATNQLFNIKTIKRLCDDVQLTQKQKDAAKEWISLLDQNKLEEEKKNYFRFGEIILQDILGYSVKDIDFDSDNVEFLFSNSQGKKTLCFEAKGTATKDLFAPQHRAKKEHETPIKQTWDYIGSIGLDYGICTNYKDFVLITKEIGYSKYYKFDFLSVKNNEDNLKEFVGIFSKERIIDKGFVKKLHEESITEEREFTNEFYKLFHETRLMLIKEFSSSPDVTKEEAIHYAQLFLNRLIFMFFAEDNQLIPERIFTKRIQEVLNSTLISEHSKLVSDEILGFFQALNKGSHRLNIFGFNGGLFEVQIPAKIYFSDLKDSSFFNDEKQNSKLSKKVKPNETLQKIIKQYGNDLNPIIINLLIMDSYDFTSEVNVNILGHIFEQSISDLEELRGEGISKRKREGVYYTPEYITDYICRNTIIPYLSKNHASTDYELVEEYADNLDELEKKFKEIKILDPACGSGAFLIKAVDVLLEIHREIQLVKESRGKYSAGEQFSLAKWSEESEIQKIIENNIYGIDINEESIEITKLSLFLKLATENRKLINLSKNIKIGNSLIDNNQFHEKAFDWEKEFLSIFEKGGFDIIMGNPPYIPIELISEKEKDYFSKNYEGIYRKYDTSILFVEKCLKNMKPNGYLGFIMPLTWQTGDNYPQFRKLVFKNFKISISKLVNLPFDVFPDAYVDTGIVIFRKHQNKTYFHAIEYQKNEKINSIDPNLGEKIEFDKVLQHSELKVFSRNSTYDYSDIVKEEDIVEFGTISDSTQGIVTSKYPISKTKKSENYLSFLIKADANRYKFQIKEISFIDSTSIPKILHLYTQPKIMIRRIVNRQNRLMAFYDDSGIITNKDYNPFIITSTDFDIFYILALLNSRLFSYWYIKKSSLALKDDFRQTTLAEIRKLGIKHITKTEQKKIGDKAKLITKLTHEYFELKDRVFRRITDNFNIKINKKLLDINELNFTTFKNEIALLVKRPLSLVEQDQWEKYFVGNTSKLNELKDKIVSIDNEIDKDVYDLYNIKDSERKLVEHSVLEPKL